MPTPLLLAAPAPLVRFCRYWLLLLACWLPALRAQAQATVTSVAPARNTRTAPRTTNVVLTYNQALNAATAANLRVFSAQRGGQLVRGGNATATSSNTLTVNPAQDFRPGETVFVTSPASVLSSGGAASRPFVYQFTTAPSQASTGTFGGGSDVNVNGQGYNPFDVAVGDIDGDGDLDLLTANFDGSGSVSIRFNQGNGTFSGSSEVGVGTETSKLVLGDVDGDGDLDLLTANRSSSTVSVRLNQGNGTFSGGSDVSVDDTPNVVVLGDVDGDGDLDLLAATRYSTVSVRLNQGNGTFGGGSDVTVGSAPMSVVVGDVDGDGDLDLLAANYSSNTVSVRLNQGNGTFSGGSNVPVGSYPTSVAMGDVDGDGDLDLLAANYLDNTVSVRLNQGNGTFGGGSNVPVGSAPISVVVGDVDGDGDLDLLAANYSSNTVSVRLNQGNGTFSGGSDVPVGDRPKSVVVGDVNGDGNLDLLTANYSDNVSVRLNLPFAPTLTSLSRTSGPVGTSLTLTGTNLSGATAVRFNGAAATFSVVSSTTITATVPAAATSGPVTVTTPGGTSNGLAFTVVTAAPTVTAPAANSTTNGLPTFKGTAPAGSTVTIYLAAGSGAAQAIGTTTATGGSFSFTPTTALTSGTYTLYATARSSSQTVSAQSNTSTFTVDATPPTVTLSSSTVANNGATTTTPVSFTAQFSEGVGTSFTASDVTVSGGSVSNVTAGTAANSYTFTVTPAVGTVRVSIAAGVVQDAVGNGNLASATYTFTYALPITAAPVLTSPASNSTTNGLPTYAGTAPTGSLVTIYLAAGSGTAQAIGTTTATGGTFSLVQPTALASGTYAVYATAQLSGQTVSAHSNTITFTVDATAPTVVSSTRQSPTAATTNASSLTFRVTFSESVTGVNATDFTLTTTAGTVSSSGRTVAAVSGSVYDVTVSGVSGSGTVRLDLNASNTSIVDAVGNAISGGYTSGLTYTLDQTAPVAGISRQNPTATVTNATVVTFRVTFSESVTGVSIGSFTLNTTGTAAGTLASVAAVSSSSYDVVASGVSGNGTLGLTLKSTGSGVTDGAGNAPSGVTGPTYTLDQTAPTVTLSSTAGTSGSPTSTTPFSFTATFSEPVTGFAAGDILVSNGTVTSGPTAGSGNSFTFQVTPTTPGTATTVQVRAGVAQDQAGNGNSASSTYALTFQAPTITVTPTNGTLTSGTQGTAYSVTFTASGGSGSYTYGLSGNLPSGLTFAGSTLAGTPTASGTFGFRITATDNSAAPGPYSGFRDYTLTIGALPLTATVSTTASSPTNTSPIPFAVSFSQSVGTTFVASDVTVTGGTVTSGSFSGSGAGPYAFTVTPTGAGTVTVSVAASVATDANNTGNAASNAVSVQYQLPTTTAPVVTSPANGSTVNGLPTYAGTAPAGSTVTIYLAVGSNVAQAIGTTTATGGNFSLTPTTALASGSYAVYATALASGSTASANSNTNSFTVDATRPTVTLSSPNGTSGSTSSTTPLAFTATFFEPVTGFIASSITVTNGTVSSGPTVSSGNSYTFSVTPTTAGTATSVTVAANAAQDAAGNGNTASATYSLTYVAPVTLLTWNGSVNQDWNTPANWTPNQVPTAGTDVLIPTGVRFYPLVPATGAATRTLTLQSATMLTQSAGTLTVTGNLTSSGVIAKSAGTIAVTGDLSNTGTLTQSGGDITVAGSLTNNSSGTLNQTAGTVAVTGNLTNNGTFATGAGTVLLGGGASTSAILGSAAIRFYNLTIQAGGAQLSTSAGASVRRVLTLTGSFATNANLFTLESASTGDALVVNSGGVVAGTATVQRYITPSLNPGPGYRHYSAPVNTSTVADLTTSGFSPTANPAYNTAAAPTSVSPFPTVYGYDDARLSLSNNLAPFDKGYFSPAALSDPLAVGRGYTVNLAASELVDFQGSLTNGDLPLTLTSSRPSYAEGGWQLLGNPYPAPLDYSRVAAADRLGLEAAIYVYQSTSQYAGQYRSYINGIGNPVLTLGQAFFARVASGLSSATMTFRNRQRLTVPNGTTFQRTAETRPLVVLTLQGVGSPLLDEATVYFEQGATSGFDPSFDAQKLSNLTGLNLSTSLASGQQLSIDGQPELGTAQRIVPLTVGVPTPGSYTLAASQLLNLSAVPVYLRDRQSGALIDLAQQPTYPFMVSNATTLVTGRFELVFSPQQVLATVPAALARQVSVYPNPATTQVTIELPAALTHTTVTATLVDALGRVVRTQVLPVGLATHTLPLTDLATGVYALRLRTEAGLLVKKLVLD